MTPDRELLRRYVQQDSEEAFAEIAHRHVNLVYGAALRQLCGNVSLAKDVTQAVFTALAIKAKAVPSVTHLSAWLHATTRFTVSHTVRTERRRQDREQKAETMHALLAEPDSHHPLEIPPQLIDEALEGLEESDREAILLRFFGGQSFAAIGAIMEISDDSARMRVTRALERIRRLFARKGVTSSAAAVGAALANQVIAAPEGLAASIATTALAGTAAVTATAGTKLGIIAFMTTTKTIWLASAAVIFALGYSAYRHHEAMIYQQGAAGSVQAQDRLQGKLKQSEQPAAKFNHKTAVAAESASKTVSIPETERRKLVAAKMARMKPLLAGGMPITGAAVLMVKGKPVDQPVEFFIGKETRIDVGDDGIYTVTPSLDQDGSVRYAISLLEREADGSSGKIKVHVVCVVSPWGPFNFGSLDDGTTLGFVPDMAGP